MLGGTVLRSGRHADRRWWRRAGGARATLGAVAALGRPCGEASVVGRRPSDHTEWEAREAGCLGAAGTLDVRPESRAVPPASSTSHMCRRARASGQSRCPHFPCRPICCAPWRLGMGACPRPPSQAALRPRPVVARASSQTSCLLDPSLVTSQGVAEAEKCSFRGSGPRRGHVVELGRALGTPHADGPFSCLPQAALTIVAGHHISIAEIYETELVDIEKVGGRGPARCGGVAAAASL